MAKIRLRGGGFAQWHGPVSRGPIKNAPRVVVKRSRKNLIGIRTEHVSELPKLADVVAANLAALKAIAIEAIRADEKDPAHYRLIMHEGDHADRAYWAACLLDGLTKIERLFRPDNLPLVQAALVLASDMHGLTITDHERKISAAKPILEARDELREKANKDRHAKRTREWARWNKEARTIWLRNDKLSKTDVAKRIKDNLHLRDSVATIRKRLKKVGKAG